VSAREMDVIAMGVHVVDVLARPIESIPEGQGGQLVEEASVLPIRPDGSRPAFHVVGANSSYGADDAPWDPIAAASHLHLGGPEFMGGEQAAKILSFAQQNGVVTSADILAPGEQAAAIVDWIAPALEHLDYLLPNDEQVLGLSRTDELLEGCASLIGRGVGCIAATCGAGGVVVADAEGAERVPAFETEVRVDAFASATPVLETVS
jgi:sugar/nucleoside kinase (ribokinase family)